MKPRIKFSLALASMFLVFASIAGINNATNKVNNGASAATYQGFTTNFSDDEGNSYCRTWNNAPSYNYSDSDPASGLFLSNSISIDFENNGMISVTQDANGYFNFAFSSIYQYKAFYIPFYLEKTVPANSNIYQSGQFRVESSSTQAAKTTLEFFYFDDADTSTKTPATIPERFHYLSYYEEGNKTTGFPYSLDKYTTSLNSCSRACAPTTISAINDSNVDKTYYFHFGLLMAFHNNQNYPFSFNVKFLFEQFDLDTAIEPNNLFVDGSRFTNLNDAVQEYNSKADSTLDIYQSVTASSNITLDSDNGVVNFRNNALNLSNKQLFIEKSTRLVSNSSSVESLICGGNRECIVINESDIDVTFENMLIKFSNENSNILDGIKLTTNCDNSTLDLTTSVIYSGPNQGNLIGLYAGTLFFPANFLGNSVDNAVIAYNNGYSKEMHLTGTSNNALYLYIKDPSNCSIYDEGATFTKNLCFRYDSSNLPASDSVVIYNASDELISHCRVEGYTNVNPLAKSGNDMIINKLELSVTFILGNGLQTDGAAYASYGTDYVCHFSVPNQVLYRLPQSKDKVNITIDGNPLPARYYEYDKSTGTLIIYYIEVVGDIVITANADVRVRVNYSWCNGLGIALDIEYHFSGDKIILPELPESYTPFITFLGWGLNDSDDTDLMQPGTEYTLPPTTNVTIYGYYIETEENLLNLFVAYQLHFYGNDMVDPSNNEDTGACRGPNGYYKEAKSSYNALSDYQKELFNTDAKYAAARARFIAWANANNETIDFVSYQLVPMTYRSVETVINEDISTTIILILVSIVSMGLAGLYFLKKKALNK